MADRILIIEDDKEINNLLCKALSGYCYDTKPAFNGIQGLDMLKHEKFDLALLDIMLPLKSGDRLLQQLRVFSDIPVIVISAKETTQTKIDLLRLGADDYITKPFDLDEVAARVEANLRRGRSKKTPEDTILAYKDIELNVTAKQVYVNKCEIDLTVTEIKILELLLSQPHKVFSKANLYSSVWNEEYSVDDNTLNVHMSRLRGKLKKANQREEYIETLWGLGYRLTR